MIISFSDCERTIVDINLYDMKPLEESGSATQQATEMSPNFDLTRIEFWNLVSHDKSTLAARRR